MHEERRRHLGDSSTFESSGSERTVAQVEEEIYLLAERALCGSLSLVLGAYYWGNITSSSRSVQMQQRSKRKRWVDAHCQMRRVLGP